MSSLRITAIGCLLCGALCLGLSSTGTGWRVFRNGDDVRYFGPRSAVICKGDNCRRLDYGPEVERLNSLHSKLQKLGPVVSVLEHQRIKFARDDARSRNFRGWVLTVSMIAGVMLFLALAVGLFLGRRSVRWALKGTQLVSLGAWVSSALIFCSAALATLGLSGTLNDEWVSMGWPFYLMLSACLLVVTAGFFARFSGRRDAAALDDAMEGGTEKVRCPACDEQARPGARYCDACGHALAEDGPASPGA